MPAVTETGTKLLMASAELAARVVEMTAASACVVMQRSQLFAFGSNTSRKHSEYTRMVLEKFQGGGESVAASWQGLAENYPLLADSIASKVEAFANSIKSSADTMKKTPCIVPAIGTASAFAALHISTPMHIGIFLTTAGLQSIAPLHKRVLDNMKRLSH